MTLPREWLKKKLKKYIASEEDIEEIDEEYGNEGKDDNSQEKEQLEVEIKSLKRKLSDFQQNEETASEAKRLKLENQIIRQLLSDHERNSEVDESASEVFENNLKLKKS